VALKLSGRCANSLRPALPEQAHGGIFIDLPGPRRRSWREAHLILDPREMSSGAATFPIDDDFDAVINSPPELAAELIECIGSGVLDRFSGQHIRAAVDDWRSTGAD
jgi:hypothetical protein